MQNVQQVQQKILNHMENTGYPFASVKVDSVQFRSDSMLRDASNSRKVRFIK